MTDLRSPASRLTQFIAFTALLVASGCAGTATPSTAPPADPLASTCPAATGAGTDHSDSYITTNTTWTAAGSPHRVTSSFRIEPNITLTLEPCATVKVAGGLVITVTGKLVAAGQAGKPVTIDSSGPGVRWGYITTRATPASPGPITTFIDLAYTKLVNGGLTDINGLGLIDLRGNYSSDPRQGILRVNNVSIDGTGGDYGYGVVLREGAAFTADSTALTIKNAATYPLHVTAKLVGSIPPGTYTGNGVNEIIWEGGTSLPVDEDTTIHDRGIPYRLGEPVTGNGADMRVGLSGTGAALTTLTIEAGVTIKVHPAGRLLMQTSLNSIPGSGYHPSGSLIALGTAAKPITFTSAAATPAPGDWVAVWFDGGDNSTPAPNARLDYVHVEYAGGPTYASGFHCISGNSYSFDEDSAILMFGPPATPFVTNSTISWSAADGIGRSYQADPSPDFMSGNTFISVARCKQSYPHPVAAACPTNPPCP
jgi:hypothetical protein